MRFVTIEEDCSGSDRDKKVGLSNFGQDDHTSNAI